MSMQRSISARKRRVTVLLAAAVTAGSSGWLAGTAGAAARPMDVATGAITPDHGVTIGGQVVELTGADLEAATFVQVDAGSSHSLGLTESGALYAWGGVNRFGEFGTGETDGPSTAQAVDVSGALRGKEIAQVAVGGSHSAAIDSSGRMYTWGRGGSGQLGDGREADSASPVAVDTTGVLDGKTIVRAALGAGVTIALDSDGALYSWGGGGDGENGKGLGTGLAEGSSTPLEVDTSGVLAGKTITQMCVGYDGPYVLALDSDGVVYSWGGNSRGQLGTGTLAGAGGLELSPVAVDASGVLAGREVVEVACGYYHSLARDSEGQLYSWGGNTYGQLANGSPLGADTNNPTAVDLSGFADAEVTSIGAASGVSHVVVGGWPYIIGQGVWGAIGNGSTGNVTTFTAVARDGLMAGRTIESMKSGSGAHHLVAVDEHGQVFAWGYNMSGELGDGRGGIGTPLSSLPVQLLTHAVVFGSTEHRGTDVRIEVGRGTVQATTPEHEEGDVAVHVVPIEALGAWRSAE